MRSSSGFSRVERGFTLIELLITLVIISIGLLGVAKLQAAAIAETGVARTRALMTFQAESLAAALRANEAFWQSSTVWGVRLYFAPGGAMPAVGAGSVPNTSDGTCTAPSVCTTSGMVAYDDLNTWAQSFGARFPTATALIQCSGTASTPVNCDITLNWSENTVAINRTTAVAAAASATAGAAQLTQGSLVLHIQP